MASKEILRLMLVILAQTGSAVRVFTPVTVCVAVSMVSILDDVIAITAQTCVGDICHTASAQYVVKYRKNNVDQLLWANSLCWILLIY